MIIKILVLLACIAYGMACYYLGYWAGIKKAMNKFYHGGG